MDSEDQEKYLAEQEQNYQSDTDQSEKSEDEVPSEKQEQDEIESFSAVSEIEQEQIIMVTNLSSLIPTEASNYSLAEAKGKLLCAVDSSIIYLCSTFLLVPTTFTLDPLF